LYCIDIQYTQTPHHHTTGDDMDAIIFVSIYIVKPTLFATMIFSNIGATIIIFQSLTKGE